ncbi:alkylphosphonate utilization protein [bacterium]|nr:alkylphosphonate utilization protein [bacterium]
MSQDLESDNAELASQLEQVWSQTLTQLEVYLSQLGDQSLELVTKDSQGQELVEGDTVKTIKDLKVKGSSMVIKRGTVVKKIHLLSGNPEEVDCKVDGVGLTLETQWLLKIH